MSNLNTDDLEDIKKTARLILKGEVKHLQLVPSVAIKLLTLTNDDNAKIDHLSRIIETELALAAKILRHVNSAAYSLPNKITSIKRAVNILGFSAVRRLALNQLLYQKLIKQNSSRRFDQLFFWQHCLYVASLSREIAVALQYPDTDLIYTAGLIHDIGKIVLENYGRKSYSNFISEKKNSSSILDEERRFFGLTHVDIGHVFCLEWQLPAAITSVVTYHHDQPGQSSTYAEFQQEIAIVSFANYIACMHGVGSFDEIDFQPVLQPEVLTTIDTNQLNLDFLLQHVDQEMQITREFYGIQFPSIAKLRATLVKAAINLNKTKAPGAAKPDLKVEPFFLSSLTAPHQSLNPAVFLPRTLEAIRSDFTFDRVIMLTIDPKRRYLIASHYWPRPLLPAELQRFEIAISTVSGLLLDCLREKKAVLVNGESNNNILILKQLQVTEFIAVPVLNQQRLLGALYADNSISKKTLLPTLLSKISLIAYELGIALVNAKQYEIEKKQAQLDPLTQLYNKRMINHFLSEIFQRSAFQLAKIAIGFIDIDKFKLVNDVCGHQAGDEALKIVAETMRDLTRPGDFIGRYGGEEFIFMLRNTDEAGAFCYAERIRKEIEQRGKIFCKKFHELELTASIGVATYNRNFSCYNDMIEVADHAMYIAKHEGRNKVVLLNRIPS